MMVKISTNQIAKKQTHLNLFRTSENLKRTFFALTWQQLKTENNKLNIYTQYLMKSTFETLWLFFHRLVGLVELLILYACVQFYTHRASDFRLSSKTDERLCYVSKPSLYNIFYKLFPLRNSYKSLHCYTFFIILYLRLMLKAHMDFSLGVIKMNNHLSLQIINRINHDKYCWKSRS